MKTTPFFFLIFATLLFLTPFHIPAHAGTMLIQVPPSIIPEILSDPTPDAFAPGPLNEKDFSFRWLGPPIKGLVPRFGHDTTQWVRVLNTLSVPRARFILDESSDDYSSEGGEILYAGFIQPLQKQQGHIHAEFPIALLSGEKNPIEIRIKRHDQIVHGTLVLDFTPRAQLRASLDQRVYRDANCSPFQVTLSDPTTSSANAASASSSTSHWASVGCHLVRAQGENSKVPSLEMLVFWDQGQGSQEAEIAGIPTLATSLSLWPLRLNAYADQVTLQNHQDDDSRNAHPNAITLHYKLPKMLKNGALGLGVGPYAFHLEGNGDNTTVLTALPTFYGSYSFGETFKIVSFGLITLEQHTYTDFGLYGRVENFRLLDRRLSVHLLIGGHAIAIQSQGHTYGGVSFPQGFELIYTDAFQKTKNLYFGAFLYPPIDGGSYYNVWLRWGGSFFVELNYIAWSNTFNQVAFSSSSSGLSVGMPILGF